MKIFPQLRLIDLLLSRCKIQTSLKYFNFIIRKNAATKVKDKSIFKPMIFTYIPLSQFLKFFYSSEKLTLHGKNFWFNIQWNIWGSIARTRTNVWRRVLDFQR